jgi:hypothetical protein
MQELADRSVRSTKKLDGFDRNCQSDMRSREKGK